MRLETARLILRDWRDEDLAPFLLHTNTPAVMRWLGGVMDEATCATIVGKLRSWADEYGHTFWAVQRNDDGGHLAGEIIGFCGLKRADLPTGPQGDFEIGWRLREDAWGMGFAREAAQATLAAAFGTFDAPHVVAFTVAENTPSWGLMERLGMARRKDLDFILEPTGRFEREDIIVYAITQEDWEKQA
ncbi:N-acetyltransferase [Croceicoccus ponticola]|uniref:N-acetyltransferase n=1 Tax=Croceicoccus ponticola TaxID=2217664 RepID=A0A437GYH8_9SPHN|nr:GNAT family N-acetyltransferase [Croceicoccus ponticola]RVQ67728.1 N-acetyltransferase [Croceicoccus ponticola]